MKLIEITSKDVFKNREKYYNNKQEFFLKIKNTKDLLNILNRLLWNLRERWLIK